MNKTHPEIIHKDGREDIDDYFECTTFCSLNDNENDCQTICMERHLKGNYF